MEDQQQPVPAVVFEVVETAFRVRQCEWHRRITNECARLAHRPFNDQS